MFLYRRIRPVLSPDHDNLTDTNTVLLVRQILDLAICKYGKLNAYEFEESSNLELKDRWGGYLKLALQEFYKNDFAAIAEYLKATDEPNSISPKIFRPADYRSIYACEGLAYEYWLCTARLRTIGKGLELWFLPQNNQFVYDKSPEISRAIERYDLRLKGVRFFPTLIGIVTPESNENRTSQIFSANYNVDKIDLSEFLAALGFAV